MQNPRHPLEYFEGGVPPFDNFETGCYACRAAQKDPIIGKEDDEVFYDGSPSIALVGLLAHSEGFFRQMFSAVGNVCPKRLEAFAAKRSDLSIPLESMLCCRDTLSYRLGSLVSESLDFGSPRKINALFMDLLGLSPFSKANADSYNKLLSTRNQIVHHGGIVTTKFLRHRPDLAFSNKDLHWNSIEVTPGEVEDSISWMIELARSFSFVVGHALAELEGPLILTADDLDEDYDLIEYLVGISTLYKKKDG
jgi:hypothetical protein